MKKLFFCALCTFSLCFAVFSYDVNVKIANPVLLRSGEQVQNLKSYSSKAFENEDIAHFLCKNLNKKDYGTTLHFQLATVGNAKIQTLSDALKFAFQSEEKFDFLLYGYFEENDSCVNAELKILNVNEKRIEKVFYGKDDSAHFERLANFLCENINEYFSEELFFAPTLTEEDKKNAKKLSLWLPVNIGSFVFLNEIWQNRIYGIVCFDAGFDLKMKWASLCGKNCTIDFFPRFNFDFKYGLCNPAFYSGNYFALGTNLFECISVNINKTHSIAFGIGCGYECEILQVVPKYENSTLLLENVLNLSYLAEYQILLREKWKLSSSFSGVIPLGLENPLYFQIGIGFLYQIL